MPKDGSYLIIELSLRETLEEITTGVLEYAGSMKSTPGICVFIISINLSKLYIVHPQADGESEWEDRTVPCPLRRLNSQYPYYYNQSSFDVKTMSFFPLVYLSHLYTLSFFVRSSNL